MRRTTHCFLAFVLLIGVLLLPGNPPQIEAAQPATAPAAPKGPGWQHVTLTDGSSPAEAREAAEARSATVTPQAQIAGLPTTAAEVTPEIAALARALQHDPKLIFDYVHNHIDYVPIYGTLNGAAGTLRAGRGTDADQAALFIALMEAAGYTANYVIGDVTYPVDRLANWVGAEAAQAGNVFLNGGIPIAGGAGGYQITRVWAEAEIGGETYTFDPAMKVYAETAGIADLGSALGYNRTTFLNRATSGATTGADAIQNVNEANVRADLTTYAMNLVDYIDANLPDGGVADVIGGREITPSELTAYGTTLPYALSVANESRPADLSGYRHTLRIEHEGIDQTFNTFQLADQRVTIFYEETDGNKPVLRVGGTPVMTGTDTISGTTYAMLVTVEHPYTGFDQQASFSLTSGGAYALLHDFNTVSADVLAASNARLTRYRHDGLGDGSEAVLGETLSLMGWTWLHEVHLYNELVGRVGDVVPLTHHEVGVMGQEDGVFIDVRMGFVSNVSVDGVSDTFAAFRAQTMMGSAFEHGVIEQLQGTPSASTIKMLTLNNANGDKTFLADADNWDTVEPQLQGYSAGQLAQIEYSVVTNTHTVVLPEHGDITLNDWRGTGYIDDWQNEAGTAGSMAMIISGGYYGGYGTISETVSIGEVITATFPLPPDIRYDVETPEDTDPVDMTTGAFHHTHVDFAVGRDQPLGLDFVRTYNSGDGLGRGPLGYGWRHNYEISLRRHSAGASGLGTQGARETSALIAYTYVALDLLGEDAEGRTLTEWMASSLASKWAMDQLIDNAVSVRMGGTVLPFIRLADGTYTPPPGVARALKRVGDHYALQGAENDALFFDSGGKLQSWQDANGNALTFAYDVSGNLQTVATGTGMTFTLSYSGGLLTNVADQAGRVVTYTYNTDDELTSFRDAEDNEWQYTYDSAHRLISVTRPKGNTVVTNVYDDWGRVITQTDALSNTTVLYFSRFRNALQNPEGHQTVYYLDGEGRMVGRQDAAGNRFTLDYNGVGQQVSITDRLGDTTSFTYHPQSGQVASITNALSETLGYRYTPQIQTFSDPLSATDSVTFTFYNLTGIDYPDGTDEAFDYDGAGNLRTYTDQADYDWTYMHNARGQVTSVTNPAGGTMTYAYNADATLASSTDSDTGVTTYGYDAFMRPITTTHPDGTVVQMAYDANDRAVAFTDEKGHTYAYEYDANGNLVKVTDPTGHATHYAYDLMDRLTATTDRRGRTRQFAYDATGQVISITEPSGLQMGFGYDARDWLNETTVGGQTWQTLRDDEQIVTGSTTPLGHTTSFQTDARGDVTAVTDPLGHTAYLNRDAMGRVVRTVDPLGQVTSYSYESRGLLAGVVLPEGSSATYQWNALGRLGQITDLNGSDWVYDYTPMGRTRTLTDPTNAAWQYLYDGLGRLYQTIYPDSVVLTRSYDDAGNLIESSYSDGVNLHYGYDALNQLTAANGITLTRNAEGQVTGTENPGADYGATYDEDGRLRTVTYDNGAFAVTYTYDAVTGLLSRVSDDLTGAEVTFIYDADRRLIGIDRSNGVTTTYAYDNAGRLTRIQEGNFIDLQYTLDGRGQVTQLQMEAPLDPPKYLAESNEALSYATGSQLSSDGYPYDARGRLVTSPGHTFTWDSAARLTGVNATTLSYNGLGDLVTRTEGGTTLRYDYNYALGMHPIVAEKDTATGDVLRYYVWTPGGRLLYMIDAANGNQVRFYHFDRVGSTLALTDESGDVTDAYAYAPYGQLVQHEGTNEQPFTFVGRWGVRQEGTSGSLYQMRARYYDAETAQFLSRDPEWPDLRHPKALNPYEYAMRDPVLYVDPLGTRGFIGSLVQEYLGIDLPPTGPWDFVFHATSTGYEKDPEWGYGWQGRFMTKEQREAWDREQRELREQRRREEEERRFQEWMQARHERYLRRLEQWAINQARVAARQFGGNREALLKSIQKGGAWVRQGNFWLFFADVKKWGENLDGGVWVHVEVNGEVVGIAGDELIAEGHITPEQRERGW
ncbi:MAG: RHS repeat-associated core domain-containing protein [Anaerolineae bacterium]